MVRCGIFNHGTCDVSRLIVTVAELLDHLLLLSSFRPNLFFRLSLVSIADVMITSNYTKLCDSSQHRASSNRIRFGENGERHVQKGPLITHQKRHAARNKMFSPVCTAICSVGRGTCCPPYSANSRWTFVSDIRHSDSAGFNLRML